MDASKRSGNVADVFKEDRNEKGKKEKEDRPRIASQAAMSLP
jgi:hypothetical protein